ncbi:MAG: NAD(P)-dependent oxidoreductase [Ruminococcus sp.]|nr:NAD(P)-dependent oxidoreductase [Ruminococcus sp.]
MKKIVIFGATGYIGAYLTDCLYNELSNSDYEIIAVGRRKTDHFDKYPLRYIRLDVRNADDFDKLPFDGVFAAVNLTGILPAYFSSFDPFAYIDTNISGSIRIMEYARKCGADRVLYTQTWAEQAGYWGKTQVLSPGLPRKLIYSGDHAFYSVTKAMVADSMRFYKEEYGVKDFVFRLPNVYMYAPQKSYFVDGIEKPIGYRRMIDKAANGEDIELWGDPDAFKDILYVKDLCQMMKKALTADIDGGTYNAGTGVRTTLREQIEGYIKVFSPCPEKVRIIERPEKDSFVSFVMDIQNARNELGYEPQYRFLDYLKDYKKEQELKRFDELWSQKQ